MLKQITVQLEKEAILKFQITKNLILASAINKM